MPIKINKSQLKNPPAANTARNPAPVAAEAIIKIITKNATMELKHPEQPGLFMFYFLSVKDPCRWGRSAIKYKRHGSSD